MVRYDVIGRSGPIARNLELDAAERLAEVSGCEIVPVAPVTAGADDTRALVAELRQRYEAEVATRGGGAVARRLVGKWFGATNDEWLALAARVEELERQAAEREKWYEHVTASWKAEEEDWAAERASLEARLRDAATVIERMANGATRAQCSPELDRVIAALRAGEQP